MSKSCQETLWIGIQGDWKLSRWNKSLIFINIIFYIVMKKIEIGKLKFVTTIKIKYLNKICTLEYNIDFLVNQ